MMRYSRLLTLLAVLMTWSQLMCESFVPSLTVPQAPDCSSCSREVLDTYLRQLCDAGNAMYALNDRVGVARVVLQCEQALEVRTQNNLIDQRQKDSLNVRINLLRGAYHYLNSDFDPASYSKGEEAYQTAVGYWRRLPKGVVDSQARRDTLPALHNLAQLYYKWCKYDEAAQCLQSILGELYNNYYNTEDYPELEAYSTACQGLAMCLARTQRFDEALKVLDDNMQELDASEPNVLMREAQRKRAKILLLQRDAKGGQTPQEAVTLYQQYFLQQKAEAQQSLASMDNDQREQYWMRWRPYLADCYALEDAAPGLLYDAALYSKSLLSHIYSLRQQGMSGQESVAALDVKWQDIQQRLQDGQCAIEFVQYDCRGTQQMAACVLHAQGEPQYVRLTPPDEVLTHTNYSRTVKQRIFTQEGKPKNALYLDSLLIDMVWTPALREAIAQDSVIYFAAEGYLHQLAIEYMLPSSLRGCRLHRLSSTRTLMRNRKPSGLTSALLFGGVNYNSGNKGASISGNDSIAYSNVRGTGAVFAPLAGSLSEVQTVMSCRGVASDVLRSGDEATDVALAQLAPNYGEILVSTHGFFTESDHPQATDLRPCLTDDALSQSVLVLAGANDNLKDQSFLSDQQDGLMSAREISRLDLSRADLVIFSACQMGLGYITNEGVYGMQRGLKNAGAGTLLLALWSVDDTATAFLMKAFHVGLGKGLSQYQAFSFARRCLLSWDGDSPEVVDNSAVEDDGFYNQPMYMNAFILIDCLD